MGCPLHAISIHAPLRERQKDQDFYSQHYEFQSTLPCGSDTRLMIGLFVVCIFQSTLPCGSDRVNVHHATMRAEFQSTLPCGSDNSVCFSIILFRNFNPRSLAGATMNMDYLINLLLFQSTLPCGSDHFGFLFRNVYSLFQSTLPCGSDV